MISQFCISLLKNTVQSFNLLSSHSNFPFILLEFDSQTRVLLHLFRKLSNVKAKIFNFSAFAFINLFDSFHLYFILSFFCFKSDHKLSELSFRFNPLVAFKGILDLIHFLDFGSLQCLELGLPCVDVQNGLVEIILEIRVIFVHTLNLFQSLVIFGLNIGINV